MSVQEPTPGAPLDDERLDLRHLPKLPPIPRPERFSQTLLSFRDRCQRAAYLYVKHHGGTPAHALDRGSAFHLFAAKATAVMIANDEPRIPPELARTLLDETLDEHPEFTIPIKEIDELRQMAYHFAMGVRIDPQTVACVEQKFLLTLGEYTLSGIVDLASISGQTAVIDDYKTIWAAPTQTGIDGYEGSFQGRFYAVLLTFGQPVGPDGELWPCLGERLTWVDVGERYPRHLDQNGDMLRRHYGMSRIEITAARDDIARMCAHLDYAFQTGDWPAVSGSHCSMCPCEPECPLPRDIRQYAGAINSLQDAQVASEWLERSQKQVAAIRKEIKLWAQHNGPFRFGKDRAWRFDPQVVNDTDWESLAAAVERARQFGEPFDEREHRRQRYQTRFAAHTVGREDDDET